MSLREARAGKKSENETLAFDREMFKQNPLLHEALVGYHDDDGKWVKGCKISVYADEGNLKVCFNDTVTGKIGFAVLHTGLKLSAALEEVLDLGGIEWRKSPGKRQ